jgi:hypothetical protein
MRDYTKLLEAGNKAQLEKLKQNGHKKGFNDINLEYATRRIEDEYQELSEEIWIITHDEQCINYWHKDNKDYKKIRMEAADIANFAHMIILKCDKELEQ